MSVRSASTGRPCSSLESECLRCAFGAEREVDSFVDHYMMRYTGKEVLKQIGELQKSLATVG
ncbi:hypothetical protein [Paraburkholderia caffeinilytica]|uniref:hypothetical protein n=1 Tax=Paraburkholderia caffeinilytica TaxID=1761016 RepID=UPI003DA0D3B0